MKREGQIPAGDAVLILEQVLSALSAAHEAGIVHRDLKPANVFLVKEGQQYYVKLLDFGLARRMQQKVTRIAGTPDYISPEHARGRPAGPPADLYAFGVLCFHMLTGQLPFVGNTPMEVMEKHVHSPPPVPHEVNPAIPKALSELILKLLAKDPGERPDAAQVKADLRAATRQMRTAPTMMSLAAVEPVVSTPESAKEEEKRAKELARSAQVADLKRKVKKRWPILLGAGVGLWLLLVLVYVLWPSAPPAPVAPVKHPSQPVARVQPSTRETGESREKEPVSVVQERTVVSATNPSAQEGAGGTETPFAQTPVAQTTSDETTAGENLEAEVDAGAEPEIAENPDEILDDVRRGEYLRSKRINDRLDEVSASMKQDPNLKLLLEKMYDATRSRCEQAQSLRQIRDCDDQVTLLYRTYTRNL
jgi:serine/threonine-protein kinase